MHVTGPKEDLSQLKGHEFDAEKAAKILEETLKDEDKVKELRKLIADAYEKEGYCDKSKLRRIGRALRLAAALSAIAVVADSRLPEAGRAYVNARTAEERTIAAAWVAIEAGNAGAGEIGASVIFYKLNK